MNMMTLWLILFVIFLVAEIITAGALVSIWFCIGSLFALGVAYWGGDLWVQVIVFLGVSLILLFSTKPFIKKVFKQKKTPTNADTILESLGIVKEEINNLEGKGAITIDGKTWTARNIAGDDKIPVGTKVVIEEIHGVKAMVKKVDLKED
ncbi:MAG: NfeD family protein [Eubacteriaceae bacterium]